MANLTWLADANNTQTSGYDADGQMSCQVARKGNAEAQYWLGVMALDGSGITEDYDEALHWIAISANQEYPPAQKLLRYLLATDDTSDC